jgi:hypothetical protein
MPLGTPYEKMAIPVGRRYGAIFKWARSLTSRANVTGPSMNTSWHFRRKITLEAQSKRLIDEIHSVLAGTYPEQRIVLNSIRFLANDLRLPLVCAGTHERNKRS